MGSINSLSTEDISRVKNVLSATYKQVSADFKVQQLTSGHINQTYLISNAGEQFVLQELNTQVFKNLEGVTQNILKVSAHLLQNDYPNKVLNLVPFKDSGYLFQDKWRMMEFIEESQTFLKVQSSEQAYAAARFLSSFHAHLLSLDIEGIENSIPGFLDFKSRLVQYQQAIELADKARLDNAVTAIDFLNTHQDILTSWLVLLPQIPVRVIHADPKISNFLFSKEDPNSILALIDWDTLMHGSILYDFGDMVRSYTNLKEEDDPEVGGNFSLENYKAIEEGFLLSLKDKLSEKEIENLDLGAKVVIYVQAMRFLTDYLNGDVYYATKYSEHNLDRAKSQINLLTELMQEIV